MVALGWKSGPNRQFFTMLDRLAVDHGDDWVLLVEPDTYPLGGAVGRTCGRPRHGPPRRLGHRWAAPPLDPAGARTLALAPPERCGALPGGRSRLRPIPDDGVDPVAPRPTARRAGVRLRLHHRPAEQELLAGPLAAAWRQEAARFVATAGIVNASTLAIEPARVDALLAEVAAACGNGGHRAVDAAREGPTRRRRGSLRRHDDGAGVRAFHDTWRALIPGVVAANLEVPRVEIFLHLPKTGGSSITYAAEHTPRSGARTCRRVGWTRRRVSAVPAAAAMPSGGVASSGGGPMAVTWTDSWCASGTNRGR